ncbi:MAG: hypothetical protein KDA20_10435 [Phycisphaerales bacterium]|nr:hypothetical protein [Phycisphaerales bacterium]
MIAKCLTGAAALGVLALSAQAGTVTKTYGPGYGGAIPDNDAIGYISPVVVAESFAIQSIQVRIYGLDHGYSSDLTIELRHSGVGTPTTLVTNLGFGEDADFNGDYVFEDSGANLWTVAGTVCCLEDLPPGSYQASGSGGAVISLDARYIGEDAEGPWVLRIYDDDFLVSGGFTGWELVLGGAPACPGDIPGDVNHDGVVDIADLNTVLFNFGMVCGA